jgi:outer membrane immunogenic protein
MKKILIASAIVATLAAPQAFAQASNFSGFSLGLNANFVTSSTERTAGGATAKLGEGTQTASLQGAYGFDLGGSGALGLGLTYNLGDLKGGTTGTSEFKGKDMYSVYIEPGYVLGSSTLLYGKLAYLGMKGEATTAGTTASENFDGVGYGAGARALLSRNLYLQIEFMQSDYNKKAISGTDYKPSGTTGAIGLGYRF